MDGSRCKPASCGSTGELRRWTHSPTSLTARPDAELGRAATPVRSWELNHLADQLEEYAEAGTQIN